MISRGPLLKTLGTVNPVLNNVLLRSTANNIRYNAVTKGSRLFSRSAIALNSQPVVKKPLYRKAGKFLWKSTLYLSLLGVSYFGYSLYRETNPAKTAPQATTFSNGSPRKTIVILGSGWGAISLLKSLDTTQYNVVVVSPRNYFLFTPLLPSTPVGTVELKSIVEPVKSITMRSSGEVSYYEADCTDINTKKKTVRIQPVARGKDVPEVPEMNLNYDYLVIGVGSQPTTFNIPGVYEHSSFLKEIGDAQEIRLKMMNSIEEAALLSPDDPERARLLSFVIVGGGPTGVEFAAELKDYVDQDLAKWMPELSKEIKVTLVEGMPHILSMFDKNLIDYAEKLFKKEQINLKLKTHVQAVTPTKVLGKNADSNKIEEISYGVLVWATGNAPRDVVKDLMNKLPEQNSRRGLLINDKLQLLGAESSVFAIGDCTFFPGLFPTAQVAHQEGKYLSTVFNKLHKIDQLEWRVQQQKTQNASTEIINKLQGNIKKLNDLIVPFKYHHMGSLAYVGKDKAIADIPIGGSNITSAGSFTFLFWKSAYLAMFESFRNRLLVALDWTKVFITGRDSSI
ncbi:NADH-ubiquinone reductase (H(+)-translocating) NDE1 KNAG_0E02050 [Huiozyma naganishii CBS 8797]|uniref:NADH:ubiquinone reductase (non-electrogenic) n=1 Tax=Huiozyma naganishii (strain ATCC MYA-139 / BCRC 22969 / CBS 8797 / KCTC 17520 / NBRC 10181 / NCYC 3082 / Yp74L-3) TaxID=1071383 RepID=J7RZ61_HUIN7|nr:hypothetical protein KNAG_0E02050 [Kazachstania naganishii CBS 8797]CCK70467.1 hypothetical protein KNAG_0E02050 [Kazachstania naganishii CBS 8797]